MSRQPIGPAQVQEFLEGVEYPASRDELVAAAQAAGADQPILDLIGRLPAEAYQDPGQVSDAVGEIAFGLDMDQEPEVDPDDHGLVIGPTDQETGDIEEV